MTDDEAGRIREAIADIERGKVASGVRLLRMTMAWAGKAPPPEPVIEARQPKEQRENEP